MLTDTEAVNRWEALFAPADIDQTFRTFWRDWSSVTVSRSGPVLPLATGERIALPEVFRVGRRTLGTSDHLRVMRMSGLAVLHKGRLVHEAYGQGRGAEDVAILWSVSKAITALLLGIAHGEGAIPDFNVAVTDYVPELLGTGYDGVTVQQVMDMLSGIRWREVYDDPSSEVVRSVTSFQTGSQDDFAREMVNQRPPGSFNQYASIETHVLGWVLRRATGERITDYLSSRLWSRLGVEGDMHILTDQSGEPVVFGGMFMRLRDLARIGQMVMDRGRALDGTQIVPETWLSRMAVPDLHPLMPGVGPPHAESTYGYKNQWWIPMRPDRGDFCAIGIYGQFLYVNPARQVVIAMNGAYPEYTQDGPMRTLETLCLFQTLARQLSPQQLPRRMRRDLFLKKCRR
ncbi:serine hydrolase domain-containing protein [Shimia sediminis]|uniref:serine hydrolase domain-containing protein n=1 Tax=Shimia sediminis TaxID=2497945 RepID=UPI0013E03A66|nr:serine hydrolase [Shimia sediminis]